MTRASRKKPAKAAGKTVSPAVKTGKRSSTPSRELAADASSEDAQVATLVRDLGQMIDAARRQVAVAANAALTTLYWQLGHHVRTEVLEGRRAEYGAQIVAAVGRQLETCYGRGFGEKNRAIEAARHRLVLGTGQDADIAIPAPPAKPRGARGKQR